MLSSEMRADGTQESVLRIPIGAANPPSAEMLAHRGQYMTMAGNEVYKFAVRAIPDITREAAEAAGVEVGDLRWIIPHQANQRILDTVAERLDVPADRVASVIRDTGNTSAASIPLALDRLYTAGNLAAGDLIALVGFGAGLTWGATVLRWTKEARS
jgi:3-oxoacyl-[acyl-carrier-protein] synthase-3